MNINPDKNKSSGIYLSRLRIGLGMRIYPSEMRKLYKWLKDNIQDYHNIKDN